MKTNLFKKVKWYIMGFILIAIMLSVSLSFASWDTNSLQAKLSQGVSGQYKGLVKLVDDRYLSNGELGNNGLVDVGDLVTFGNYYQNDATTKTPISWLVVEKINNQVTLLSEKIMAFGNFWGNLYFNADGNMQWGNRSRGDYYQNYSVSTLRAWLNSYENVRSDAGAPFSSNANSVIFKGFMAQAFSAEEQSVILPKTIYGMMGGQRNLGEMYEKYATITDKVWAPSWTEIYGTTANPWGYLETEGVSDGQPRAQFSYFKNNKVIYSQTNLALTSPTTAFASSADGNYSNLGLTHPENWQNTSANENSFWWLRSPIVKTPHMIHTVRKDGLGTGEWTYRGATGVRPAVIVSI